MTLKQKQQHDAIGLQRPKVMLDEQKSKARTPMSAPQNVRPGNSSDEEMSGDEDEEGDEQRAAGTEANLRRRRAAAQRRRARRNVGTMRERQITWQLPIADRAG